MKMTFAMIALTTGLAACGGSMPAPSNKLAIAEGGSRSAAEVGARGVPDAALHLKMADDQIAEAKEDIKNGDNEQADRVLGRASADAELALQLTKEAIARRVANEAQAKVQPGK